MATYLITFYMMYYIQTCMIISLDVIPVNGHQTTSQSKSRLQNDWSTQQHEAQSAQTLIGRIKEFDSLVLMFGKEINEANNLNEAIEKSKLLRADINMQHESEFANYYIEIFKLLEKEGDPKIIHKENRRLTSIVISAGDRPGAEVEYARVRINILGSFINSAASHLISQLGGSLSMEDYLQNDVIGQKTTFKVKPKVAPNNYQKTSKKFIKREPAETVKNRDEI